MISTEDIERITNVNEKYSQIAQELLIGNNASCCDGDACCESTSATTNHAVSSNKIPSLGSDKNLISFAKPLQGQVVVDLGSGPGSDVITYANVIGPKGKVIGIDFSDDMLKLANKHARELGVKNVEFRKGNIEEIPVEPETVDLIISNCVINLSQNRQEVFNSSFKVLKEGGRIVFSDFVVKDNPTEELVQNVDAVCGCYAGTTKKNYIELMQKAGFKDIEVSDEYEFTKNISGSEIDYSSSVFVGVK